MGASELSNPQMRFIHLHQSRIVTKWQNVLGGGMLRASTDRGHTATISVAELDGLMAAHLVTAGHGFGISLTEQGREWRPQQEEQMA